LSATDADAVYVISDVHGYHDDLIALLRDAGLATDDGDWCGGAATLWCLGDYVDRGPDGIGVLEVLMRMSSQASAAGGAVHSLLGNHEVMLLGVHKFGVERVPGWGDYTFTGVWLRNGGQAHDQNRLGPAHIEFLLNADVVALSAGHLLLHADTAGYLRYGSTVEEINATVREILAGDDLSGWWDCFRTLTERAAFRRKGGQDDVDRLLGALGGHTIVHGHSTIPESFGIPPDEVIAPERYALGRVLDVDGGRYMGGRLLLAQLRAPVPSADR
jgi:hypothetical protein